MNIKRQERRHRDKRNRKPSSDPDRHKAGKAQNPNRRYPGHMRMRGKPHHDAMRHGEDGKLEEECLRKNLSAIRKAKSGRV